MGYEMFRLLATCKTRTRKRKANATPELVDIDQEEKNDEMKIGEWRDSINNGLSVL